MSWITLFDGIKKLTELNQYGHIWRIIVKMFSWEQWFIISCDNWLFSRKLKNAQKALPIIMTVHINHWRLKYTQLFKIASSWLIISFYQNCRLFNRMPKRTSYQCSLFAAIKNQEYNIWSKATININKILKFWQSVSWFSWL